MSTPLESLESTVSRSLDTIATRDVLEGLARLHSLVIVSDFEGRIIWMSDELASICGGTHRHVGNDICEAFAAMRGARAQAKLREQTSHIRQHLRTHDSLSDIRLDLGQRSSRAHSIDLSAFRIETDDQKTLVVSIVHPTDDSSRVDPALREEHDMLASMLDASPSAVLVVDSAGFISYANPAVAPILAIETEKIVGKPIALYLPYAPDFVQAVSGLRGEYELEDEVLRLGPGPGESERWISVTTRRQTRKNGGAAGRFIYISDVTKHVREVHELARKNAELESYVAIVSHDLRSPLVSLLGFTRLLRQDYDDVFDDTGRHFADRIEQAGRTMETLIEDLLELSRIGSSTEHRALVDTRSVLLQLEAELKLRLDEADAQLEIPSTPPRVLCDRTRLYQLFSNLVGNALQHMGPCSDRRIRVAIETHAEHHLITVKDSGAGIPAEDHDRIFEVFQSRTKPDLRGAATGIGLAIVRKIAETHGGRAWVESQPGQGACFHVILPRA